MKTFRNLENYKAMHKETAKKKGVEKEFKKAPTLTQARVVLWGKRQKTFTCCKDVCYQCAKR